jgi:hypothetical protein
MEIAILIILALACTGNIILQISNSLLLIKVFEILKGIQEDANLKDEAKLKATGLVEVATEQSNYPLRLR